MLRELWVFVFVFFWWKKDLLGVEKKLLLNLMRDKTVTVTIVGC